MINVGRPCLVQLRHQNFLLVQADCVLWRCQQDLAERKPYKSSQKAEQSHSVNQSRSHEVASRLRHPFDTFDTSVQIKLMAVMAVMAPALLPLCCSRCSRCSLALYIRLHQTLSDFILSDSDAFSCSISLHGFLSFSHTSWRKSAKPSRTIGTNNLIRSLSNVHVVSLNQPSTVLSFFCIVRSTSPAVLQQLHNLLVAFKSVMACLMSRTTQIGQALLCWHLWQPFSESTCRRAEYLSPCIDLHHGSSWHVISNPTSMQDVIWMESFLRALLRKSFGSTCCSSRVHCPHGCQAFLGLWHPGSTC